VFASIALAQRIDLAEAAMIREVAAASPGMLVVHELGGGAVGAIADDGSPFQKVIGWGWGDEREQDERLRALERAAQARGTSVPIELSTLASAGRASSLHALGYAVVGFENVLGRSLTEAAPIGSSTISVERVRATNEDAFVETMLDAFASADTEGVASHEHFPRDTVERAMRAMAAIPSHRRWLARVDGTIAGAAGMRVDGDLAQLVGAGTLPAFRRRGVQTALLAARLADAHASGCRLATITTQPGSPSQRNAHGRGFALLYARAVFVRDGTVAPTGA
jgi:GNAT superfamily N-acetyltransferase